MLLRYRGILAGETPVVNKRIWISISVYSAEYIHVTASIIVKIIGNEFLSDFLRKVRDTDEKANSDKKIRMS